MVLNTKNNFLIPTPLGAAISFAFANLLLASLNYRTILHFNKPEDMVRTDALSSHLAVQLEFLNSRVLPTLVTAAFWAGIGLLVYCIVWYVSSLLGNAYEGISTLHGFVFPDREDRRAYRMALAGQVVIRFAATLGLVLWVILLFTHIIPYLSPRYAQAFGGLTETGKLIWVLLSPLLLSLYFLLFAPLCRAIILHPRLFSDD